MQIQITLDAVEPPAGAVRLVSASVATSDAETGEDTPFVGWLGMLRALSDLIAPASLHSSGQG